MIDKNKLFHVTRLNKCRYCHNIYSTCPPFTVHMLTDADATCQCTVHDAIVVNATPYAQ